MKHAEYFLCSTRNLAWSSFRNKENPALLYAVCDLSSCFRQRHDVGFSSGIFLWTYSLDWWSRQSNRKNQSSNECKSKLKRPTPGKVCGKWTWVCQFFETRALKAHINNAREGYPGVHEGKKPLSKNRNDLQARSRANANECWNREKRNRSRHPWTTKLKDGRKWLK